MNYCLLITSKMQYWSYTFLIFLVTLNISFSQQLPMCGTDLVMQRYLSNHPSKKLNQNLHQSNSSMNLDTKIIPIVFHVIHDGHQIGEDENISVVQIEDVVSIMNEDFSASNPDLENVIDGFENIIGNANIEFRLAKLDPYGNCTGGINRVVSDMSNQANDCIKELIAWDDTKYVNIWVVEDIENSIGAAAYTYLPGTLWGDEVEGIIINHEYVGSIGASSNTPYKRHTLSHEFGHYFNLSHTWGWGENGDTDNCFADDDVSDTPNTIGAYSTCNLSQETCNSLDNIQNFMDYSSCTCMFTVGQANRMQNCLNSSVSGRNNLWSNSNLWETGTHDNYVSDACPPSVDFFTSEVDRICANTQISFINNSLNLDQQAVFSWTFLGADIEFSNEENPIVNFSSPGEYDVTLSVSTINGESSLTKTYVVYPPPITLNEDFQNTQFPNNLEEPSLSWFIDAPNGEENISWSRTPISSTSTTGSVRIRSRDFNCYKFHNLYTHTMDLSNYGLGIGEPLKLLFDLAYGKRNNQTNDLLQILYSKDCGETWQVRASWDTEDLVTTSGGNVGNNFIPNSQEWMEKSVNIQAAAEQNDVMIKFEFRGDRGTYLYIDNVRLTGEWININEENNLESQKYIVRKVDFLGRENSNSRVYINIFNDGSVTKNYDF